MREIITVENEDIFLNQVKNNIQGLRECHCPQKIVDMLDEWLLNLLFDLDRYNRWIKAYKDNQAL